MDQTWHPDHFFCTQCGCQFGEDGFQEKDGKPYCKDDYLAMFAMKCKGCAEAITEGYISALNGQWHPQCFVCRVSLIVVVVLVRGWGQKQRCQVVNLMIFRRIELFFWWFLVEFCCFLMILFWFWGFFDGFDPFFYSIQMKWIGFESIWM